MNLQGVYSTFKTESGASPPIVFDYQLSFAKINDKNTRYFLNGNGLYPYTGTGTGSLPPCTFINFF